MLLRVRALMSRLHESLFLIPFVFVVVAVGLSWATVAIDREFGAELEGFPLVLSTTTASARALLATVAVATITVAGFVISITLLSVQMSSSQYSPRVLRNFLRDQFQQVIVGLVVGTFTYALVVLAVTRGPADVERANLSVTVALAMAVVSIMGLIAFIDRATRTLQSTEIVRLIADETLERVKQRHIGGRGLRMREEPPDLDVEPMVITAPVRGWIRQIDADAILDLLPPGATARLDVRVGEFVAAGDPLVTVWAERPPKRLDRRIWRAFDIGAARSMDEDVAFGIRQLVDVAVRALSPGINDPTTAIEAINQLGAVLGEILPGDIPPRVVDDDEGRRLYRPHDFDRGAFINAAFADVRRAAATQPAVVQALMYQLGRLAGILEAHEQPLLIEPLRREARLAVAGIRKAGVLEEDIIPIVELGRRFGLLREDDEEPEVPASTEESGDSTDVAPTFPEDLDAAPSQDEPVPQAGPAPG